MVHFAGPAGVGGVWIGRGCSARKGRVGEGLSRGVRRQGGRSVRGRRSGRETRRDELRQRVTAICPRGAAGGCGGDVCFVLYVFVVFRGEVRARRRQWASSACRRQGSAAQQCLLNQREETEEMTTVDSVLAERR